MFRLKELRLENGIKRSKMSADLGINAGTLANYENELRQAPHRRIRGHVQRLPLEIAQLQ